MVLLLICPFFSLQIAHKTQLHSEDLTLFLINKLLHCFKNSCFFWSNSRRQEKHTTAWIHVHNLVQPVIGCLQLPITSIYCPSFLSGPWPGALITATMLSSGITNMLSLCGERERSEHYWQSEWSLNPPRNQGHAVGNLEDPTDGAATRAPLWSK